MFIKTGRANALHKHKADEVQRRLDLISHLLGYEVADLEEAGIALVEGGYARRWRPSPKKGRAEIYARCKGVAFEVIVEGENHPRKVWADEMPRIVKGQSKWRLRVVSTYDLRGNPTGGDWGGEKIPL